MNPIYGIHGSVEVNSGHGAGIKWIINEPFQTWYQVAELMTPNLLITDPARPTGAKSLGTQW